AIALVGALQLVPLPPDLLKSISPGSDRFLRAYNFGYALALNGPSGTDVGPGPARFAISVAPQQTMLALQLFGALALLLIGLLRIMSGSMALRAARGIVFIGTVLALVGIIQKGALGDDAFLGMRIYGFWTPESLLTTPFGPFVNKNHFAGWMLLAIPIACGLVLRAFELGASERATLRERIIWLGDAEGGRTAVLLFATFLMVASLVMTKSRSGLAGLVCVGFGVASLHLRRRGGRAGLLTVIAGGCLLMLALAWAGRDTALGRLVTETDSVALRLQIWSGALAVAREFPLLGAGLDSFGRVMLQYQTSGAQHYQEAHNDYLQLLAEGGLVLAAVAAATLLVVAGTIRQRFASHADRADLYWVRAGATIGLLGIALQSTVEFSLQMPGIAALFVLVLAIAMYSPSSIDARRTPRRSF
ncbi:MAG: O-antigen ligase family protein, partial [Vicinamibacterales bacterium]